MKQPTKNLSSNLTQKLEFPSMLKSEVGVIVNLFDRKEIMDLLLIFHEQKHVMK